MIIYDPSADFGIKADPYVPIYEVETVEDVIVEGSTTPTINKDANILNTEGSTIDFNALITAQIGDDPAFTARNPEVATVSELGYVERVSDGTAQILVESGYNKQIVSVPVSREVGTTTSVFSSWRSGSLAKFVTDRTAALTSGVTPSFETRSLTSGSCFCLPYLSAMNGIAESVNGSTWMGFTAITTRHVVTVAHIGDYTGLTISFNAGSTVNRILTRRYVVPGTDVAVYLLDSALPSTVRPLRLLPSNISLYLPNPQFSVPLLFTDRNQLANIGATTFINSENFGISRYSGVDPGFYDIPSNGTSGKPVMVTTATVSISIAVLGLFAYSTSGRSLHALDWAGIIPAVDALAGISTGLQPTRVSLGVYPQYP